MKTSLTATLIASLAAPVMAGGPVIIEDDVEVVAEKPASSVGLLPILLVVALGVAVLTQDEEECQQYGSVCR